MSDKFRVLIADSMSSRAVEILSAASATEVDDRAGISADELESAIGDYNGLLVRSRTKVTAAIIERARNLKVIGRAGIGVDNIDLDAATARGIHVENAPHGNLVTTAEHAICLLLSLARNIPQATASLKAGKWDKKKLGGRELRDKNFGVIGMGNIGKIVAELGRGLKMNVIAYDPFVTAKVAEELGVELVSLDDLLARADFITIHTPLNDKTRGLIGSAEFGKMKKGVMLVQAARGGIVDEAALLAALEDGTVAGAAVDVFVEEPVPADSKLVAHPNVICTPHLGASTAEAQENVARQVAEQMSDYLLTGAVTNALNMPSISAEEAPRLKPFVELAEKLGTFAGQIVDAGLEAIEIEFEGHVAELNTKPLVCAVLTGILRPQLQNVNMVSAPAIAQKRGIAFVESKRKTSPIYNSLIRIRVRTDGTWRTLAGTVFAGAPKIIEVKGMALEADFQPVMLFTNNEDKPGFIGTLGTILGDAQINIGTLHLGRDRARQEAIAIIGVDEVVPEEIIAKLRALPTVRYAKVLHFVRLQTNGTDVAII